MSAAVPAERSPHFVVGLTFPGELRDKVRPVADLLSVRFGGVDHILYDHYHQGPFAGPGLDEVLPQLYLACDLVVVFLCTRYHEKPWCIKEWAVVRQVIDDSRQRRRVMFLWHGPQEQADLDRLGLSAERDGFLHIDNCEPRQIFEEIIRKFQFPYPGQPGNPVQQALAPEALDQLLRLPDRRPQQEAIGQALDRVTAQSRPGPLLVILHAEEDQELWAYGERVRQESGLDRQGQPRPIRSELLPWSLLPPDSPGFGEAFEAVLGRQLRCGSGHGTGLDSIARDVPLMLWSSLKTDCWGRHTDQQLHRIRRFWQESERFADQRLLHLVSIESLQPPPYRPGIPLLHWLCQRPLHWWQWRPWRQANRAIRACLEELAASAPADSTVLVVPRLDGVPRGEAEEWVNHPMVQTFMAGQDLSRLNEEIRALYRRWHQEQGPDRVMPMEQLVGALRQALERLRPLPSTR